VSQFSASHDLVVAAIVAISILSACGDPDDSDPPDDTPGDSDAGTGSESDSGSGSGDIDSGSRPTGNRVGVTVFTDNGSGPDLTAIVIFADPDNQLVNEGLVGPNGDAEADLPDGGTVHVLRVIEDSPGERRVNLVSMVGVEPGDELVFGAAAGLQTGGAAVVEGTFTPVDGATDYLFYHPCGTGFGVITGFAGLTSYEGCLPPTFQVLGTATSRVDPSFVPKYCSFTAEGSGFVAPLMQDMVPFTVRLTNAPEATFTRLDRKTLLPPHFTIAGAPVEFGDPVPAGNSTVELRYPPSATAVTLVEAVFGTLFGPQQLFSTRISGVAASVDIDLDALPLPTFTSEPELSGRIITWTQTGSGEPDLRQAFASSTHTAGGVTYAVQWTVIDGASGSTVELPGLPDQFAEVDPTQQLTSQPGQAGAEYVDYSNVDGYDQARRLPIGSLMSSDGGSCETCGLFGGQLYSKRVSTSFPR
jgi:hypothetical protein